MEHNKTTYTVTLMWLKSQYNTLLFVLDEACHKSQFTLQEEMRISTLLISSLFLAMLLAAMQQSQCRASKQAHMVSTAGSDGYDAIICISCYDISKVNER